jgi:tRNA(fMet)-specific endonuclease VapC
MIYALDTNIVSFILRPGRNQEVVRQFEKIIEQGDDYVIPPIAYYEITWYLLRKKAEAQFRVFVRIYKNAYAKVNMGEADFLKAAQIKANLEEQGAPLGNNDADILIAAYCIAHDYTLVTDNVSDFKRIDGLKYVNWKG